MAIEQDEQANDLTNLLPQVLIDRGFVLRPVELLGSYSSIRNNCLHAGCAKEKYSLIWPGYDYGPGFMDGFLQIISIHHTPEGAVCLGIRFLKKIGSVPCNFNPKATHDTWTWEVVG